MASHPGEVTQLLKEWRQGDRAALDKLTPLVYAQLRRMARQCMRSEHDARSFEGTSLVHEAFRRLIDGAAVDWQDRAHFFAVSAQLMRRILVDAARARRRAKRGGTMNRPLQGIDLDRLSAPHSDGAETLCALDDALQALAQMDRRQSQVVELRFFGGLTVEETATALGVSAQTVMRDWRLARAWLARELRNPPHPAAPRKD